MKKIIALNGLLLIFLFSAKFSDENLPEQILALAQNRVSPLRRTEQIEHQIPIVLEVPTLAPQTLEVTEPKEFLVKEEKIETSPTHYTPSKAQYNYAQETYLPHYQPISRVPTFLPKRIALSHAEGYGHHIKLYRSNYSSAEVLFAPEAQGGAFLPMLDLRGYRFDNTKYALAFGFVGRYIPDCKDYFCQMLGFNIYYDYSPKTQGYHNQLGGGIEILGTRWDIRGNFYVPFGEKQRCCDRKCVNGWLACSYNAEFGYLIADCGPFYLYSAIGPYYIISCECKERQRGGMLRIVPQYKDYVALNLKFSYDSLFRAIFQAELIISLPLYQMHVPERYPCNLSNRQIYQRVER